jgi:hypothetical protein
LVYDAARAEGGTIEQQSGADGFVSGDVDAGGGWDGGLNRRKQRSRVVEVGGMGMGKTEAAARGKGGGGGSSETGV